MKHHLHLSGAEARGWVQEAKLRRAVRVWDNALAGGQVGVAQTRLMARIAANPRIEPEVLTVGVWNLMVDAMDVSYVEFERRALMWEALADPIGAAERTERNRQRRHAVTHQDTDGGWALHASFDEVGGPEFSEIFSWFVDREFDNDCAAAIREHGNGNVDVTELCRTETQRRADAISEMARAAAVCPPDRDHRGVTVGADPSCRDLRQQRRHRPGPHPTVVHRTRSRRRHAARTRLCLARLRSTPHLVPRRPPHQLVDARTNQPRQRRPTMCPPQLPQRTRRHDVRP